MGERIKINASEATSPFETVPTSTYDLKVASAKFQVSQAGNDMIVAYYEVEGGEWAGKRIRENIMIDQKSGRFRINQICTAGNLDPDDFDLDDWIGITFEAEVEKTESEEYGEQNRVNPLIQVKGGRPVKRRLEQ